MSVDCMCLIVLRRGVSTGLSYLFSDGGRDPSTRLMLKALLVDQRKIEPPVVVNTSLVEAPLLVHPDHKRAVITLLNWTASTPVVPPAGAGSNNPTDGTWMKNSGTAGHSKAIHSCGSKSGNEVFKAVDGILEFVLGSDGWAADETQQGTEDWIVFDLGAAPPRVNALALWAAGDGVSCCDARVHLSGLLPPQQLLYLPPS
jgi:hypothetical protein